MHIVVLVWKWEAKGRIGHRVFGVPAIDLIAGVARVRAEILPIGAAELTGAAGPTEPRNADPSARHERRHLATDRLDSADDLMTGNYGDRRIRQLPIDHVKVGAAHAAREDLHERIGWPGCRFIGLD